MKIIINNLIQFIFFLEYLILVDTCRSCTFFDMKTYNIVYPPKGGLHMKHITQFMYTKFNVYVLFSIIHLCLAMVGKVAFETLFATFLVFKLKHTIFVRKLIFTFWERDFLHALHLKQMFLILNLTF